jgi:hypothetical protein
MRIIILFIIACISLVVPLLAVTLGLANGGIHAKTPPNSVKVMPEEPSLSFDASQVKDAFTAIGVVAAALLSYAVVAIIRRIWKTVLVVTILIGIAETPFVGRLIQDVFEVLSAGI